MTNELLTRIFVLLDLKCDYFPSSNEKISEQLRDPGSLFHFVREGGVTPLKFNSSSKKRGRILIYTNHYKFVKPSSIEEKQDI